MESRLPYYVKSPRVYASVMEIKNLVHWRCEHPTLPFRMVLERKDGTVVTAAGVTLAECAITMFQCADYGRLSARQVANGIIRVMPDRVDNDGHIRELVDILFKARSKPENTVRN